MLILDSCSALQLALGTAEGTVIQGLMLKGERVLAPDLFYYEFVHILCKYVRGGLIDSNAAKKCLWKGVGFVDEFVHASEYCTESLLESLRLGHSSYDIFYLLLAKRTGGTLFTFDKKLARLATKNGVGTIFDLEVDGATTHVCRDVEQGPGRTYTRDELFGWWNGLPDEERASIEADCMR